MLRRIRPHLSFANVVSITALFIALGGVSYAAVKLPKNSVGSTQIKKNAVTGSKVRNSSLTGSDIKNSSLRGGDIKNSSLTGADLKNSSVTGSDVKDGSLTAKDFSGSVQGAQGPAGPQGAAGPTGGTGATGATGPQGDPGPLLEVVPPGKTLRGRWGIDYTVPSGLPSAITGTTTVGYVFPMPQNLTEHIGFTLPADVCPFDAGVLSAAPGHLCVQVNSVAGFGSPATSPGTVTVFDNALGFRLSLPQGATSPGRYTAEGTWAATAP